MRIFPTLLFGFLLSGCGLDAKPMRFVCGNLLDGNIETYQPTPLFAEIQRDAGRDDCVIGKSGKPECARDGPPLDDTQFKSDPIVNALSRAMARDKPMSTKDREAPKERPEVALLLLSGGGAWGAYGAGFLDQLKRDDWAVVTGVSTGAMQGLFVAAGDYKRLAAEYSPAGDSDLAKSNGFIGIATKGSQYDLSPLRAKVLAYLTPANLSASPLVRMLAPGRPDFSVALVEARSGDLKVVHVTRLVRTAFAGAPDRAKLDRVADCVAGLVLASSSIPVRLTPVQIDGTTYMDGGVRSSVFDAGIARRMAFAARSADAPVPHLWVIRNGPTIAFRDVPDKRKPELAEVDARPDAYRVGMRGYSTIVNENEVMSIASLRLRYPTGPIDVTTADGFGDPTRPSHCTRSADKLFDPTFMKCLVQWGRDKSQSPKPWISLKPLPPEVGRALS